MPIALFAARLAAFAPAAEAAPLVVQVGFQAVADAGATRVPLDHRFRTGDRFRVEIRASQGGYLYLFLRSGEAASAPLWPPGGGAQAIAAEEELTVPAGGSLRLTAADGPERIQLLFARAPLADPGAVVAPRPGVRRIRQIRLRGLDVEPGPAGSVPLSAFRADLDDRGVAVLELPLHRP